MIKQCAVIFGCLGFGEIVVWFTGIQIPSSIIGMLLLTILLHFGVVKEGSVKGISKILLDNLGFFFIPPGVALMLYFDIIESELLPIVIATVISTILVLVSTGLTHQLIRKYGHSKK